MVLLKKIVFPAAELNRLHYWKQIFNCNDPMHLLMDIGMQFWKLMKGDSKNEWDRVDDEKARHRSAFMPLRRGERKTPAKLPWRLFPADQKAIDDMARKINVPGMGADGLRNTFQHTGFLKAHHWLSILGPLGQFLICRPEVPLSLEFKTLFRDYCSLFQRLFAHSIAVNDLDVLEMELIKLLARSEVMLPLTFNTSVKHQTLHIVKYIRLYGPLPGWWTFFAERFAKNIKASVGSSLNPQLQAMRNLAITASLDFCRISKDEEWILEANGRIANVDPFSAPQVM